MINIPEKFKEFCTENKIPFSVNDSIRSYDSSTLFCPAGMQQFKHHFKDQNYRGKTSANIQKCLRLGDLDSFGDGTHLGVFNMMGFFSFREYSVEDAINFWLLFLEADLGLEVDYVTIHPDKLEWSEFYPDIKVCHDKDCKWTDGEIGGYCTEFFTNGIEIGNIVNPLGDCIDVGFGLERLDMIVNGTQPPTKNETLITTINEITNAGYLPSNTKQGYVLRRLIRLLVKTQGEIDSDIFRSEKNRLDKLVEKYYSMKDKHTGQTTEWWYETHGIDLDLI